MPEVGFYNTDDRNRELGYRSKYFLNNGGVGELSYNGYHFPPGITSRVTIVPEYGKDDRVVKWLTVALQIEFIFTDPAVHVKDAGVPGPNGQITEISAHRLIERLNQPGQELCFDAQGLGFLKINSDQDNRRIKDLDNGPKPQVTEMQPIGGGNAFRVQWLCTTRISPLVTDYDGDFVSFSYNISWDFDESRFLTRTVKGEVELIPPILSRDTEEQRQVYDIPSVTYIGEIDKVRAYINRLFPQLPEFERTQQLSISENKRVVGFTLSDKERMSESFYPPGVSTFSLDQAVSSNLDENGFYQWDVVFTGSFKALKGEGGIQASKNLAWFWLWKILKAKRDRFFQNISTAVETTQPSDSTAETFGISQIPTRDFLMYPTMVNFTDEIYGDKVRFTVGYLVISSASILMHGLGIFTPVDSNLVAGMDKNAWVRYLSTSARDVTIPRGMSMPKKEVIVDVCNPLVQPEQDDSQSQASQQTISEGPLDAIVPKRGRDVISYKNKITFVEQHHTVKGQVLKENVRNRDAVKKTTDFENEVQGGQPSTGSELKHSPWSTDNITSPGAQAYEIEAACTSSMEPTRYIILEGHAERLTGPIQPPVLISVGDAIAYKDSTLGLDIVDVDVRPTGIKDSSNKVVDKYKTRWKLHYVLDRIPANGRVVTSGNPKRYSV